MVATHARLPVPLLANTNPRIILTHTLQCLRPRRCRMLRMRVTAASHRSRSDSVHRPDAVGHDNSRSDHKINILSFVRTLWQRGQDGMQLALYLLATAGAVSVLTSSRGQWSGMPPYAAATLQAAVPTVSSGQSHSLQEITTYKFVRMLSSRRTITKLMAIAAVIFPVFLVGGYLIGRNGDQTISQSLYEAYTVVVNIPGADATGADRSPAQRIVLGLLYMCHIAMFATLLGVVVDDFTNRINELRAGNYNLCETGHTLILNWNNFTPSLLRQMAVAREERQSSFRKPVVVVADIDKDMLDNMVAEALGEDLKLDVITRQGCAHDIDTLEAVAAGTAGEVILLVPACAELGAVCDQKVAATLAALDGLNGGKAHGQNVIIQMNTRQAARPFYSAARQVFSGGEENVGLVPVNAKERSQRLLAQCAMQPGLSNVYQSILMQSKDSAEFYILDMPEKLEGWQYQDLRRGVGGGVVVGYMRDGKFVCNPAEHDALLAGDKVVVLTQDDERVKFPSAKKSVLPPQGQLDSLPVPHAANAAAQAMRQVVLLGWPGNVPIMPVADGIGDFATPGTTCTVVGINKPSDWQHKSGNVKFQFLEGDATDVATWTQAVSSGVDAVILGPGVVEEGASSDDADAQVIAHLLHLNTLSQLSGRTKPLHVVAMVRKPRSQELIRQLMLPPNDSNRAITVDIILPEDLLSGIITQVAAQPQLVEVFSELVSPETTDNDLGAELVLRHGSTLGLPYNQKLTFGDISDAARRVGDTVVGVMDARGNVVTAPPAKREFTLTPSTHLVVITHDYQGAMAMENGWA